MVISRYFFGVVIGPDGEYLMVAEIGKGKIHRYRLKCENAGCKDLFAEPLKDHVGYISLNATDTF